MKIDEFFAQENIALPSDLVLVAAAFLEGQGFRFLYDYGVDNAVEMADRVMGQQSRIVNFGKTGRLQKIASKNAPSVIPHRRVKQSPFLRTSSGSSIRRSKSNQSQS